MQALTVNEIKQVIGGKGNSKGGNTVKNIGYWTVIGGVASVAGLLVGASIGSMVGLTEAYFDADFEASGTAYFWTCLGMEAG